jgi:hypothetical protein
MSFGALNHQLMKLFVPATWTTQRGLINRRLLNLVTARAAYGRG